MIALTSIINGIIVGIVQGISEWLPVSSKTQVLIVSTYLLHLTYSQAYTFGLFMEIGTIIAAIIYFRKDLATLIKALVLRGSHGDNQLLIYVIVTTIITGIIGAPLYIFADSLKSIPIGIPMVILGVILIVDAFLIFYSKKKAQGAARRKFADLKMKDYVLIGIAQGIAALPGVSRSGTTTSTMLLLNIEPDEAFRLSFLIGIFAAVAAFGLTLVVSHTNVDIAISQIGLLGLATAIVVSIIISLFLIRFLIKVAGKSKIVYLTAALGMLAIFAGLIAIITGIAAS